MKHLGIAALIVPFAAIAQSYFARRTAAGDASVLYILAGAILAAAVGPAVWPGVFRRQEAVTEGRPSANDRRDGLLALFTGAFIALAAAVQMAGNFGRAMLDGFPLLAIAGVSAAYGFSRLEGWRFTSNLRDWAVAVRRNWWEAAALAAIVLFGAWMRLWQLDYFPPANGVGIVDEAQVGKMVMDALAGQRHWQFPTLIYPAAVLFQVFEPSMLILRLSPVMAGIATVPAFYLLARLMVDCPAALAATLLLAASRWHASTNRLMLAINPETLEAVLAFYFLYRGWRSGGGMSFLLAGGMTVVGLYGYAGYRIVPVLIIVLATLMLAGDLVNTLRAGAGQRQQAARLLKLHARGLAILAAGAFIILLPYLGIISRDPVNAFTERFTSIIPLMTAQDRLSVMRGMGERTREALLLFNMRGEGAPLYNLPGEPMLDPVSAMLFGLALVTSIVYVWRGYTALPVLWFGLTLVGGAIVTNNLQTYRILGIVPAVFLLVAFMLDAAWRWLQRALPGQARFLLAAPLCALALAACYFNASNFFGRQVHNPDVRKEFIHATEITAAYLKRQPGRPYVHLMTSMPFFERGMDYGWLAGFPRGRADLLLLDALPHREDDESVLYVFTQPYADPLPAQAVAEFYPGVTCDEEYSPWQALFYIACRVPAEQVSQWRGLTGRYYHGDSTEGEVAFSRKDATLNFAWGADTIPISGTFSVEWEGAFFVTSNTPMALSIESTSPFTVSVGDVTLDSAAAPQRTITLAQGWHRIKARLAGASSGGRTLFYQTVEGKKEALGPQYFSPFLAIHGLRGRFYAGPAWQGPVLVERIDPFMDFLALTESPETRPGKNMPHGPFTAEWAAELTIADGGVYRLRAGAISGQTDVLIDDRLIVKTAQGSFNQTTSSEADVHLAPGKHRLRVRYAFKEGHIARAWLYWAPPGQDMQMIPYRALTPLAN